MFCYVSCLCIDQVEAYFTHQREQRLTSLLQSLALEEQAAVTRMVEKHAQEMLALIAKKVSDIHKQVK